jgi:hypothetical protein
METYIIERGRVVLSFALGMPMVAVGRKQAKNLFEVIVWLYLGF